MVRSHGYDVQPLHQFAKPAPDAVALGGGAVFLGDGETDPDRALVGASAALEGKGRAGNPRAIGNGEEVRPLPQPIHDWVPKARSPAQALRRLRPRARRAARTLRPPAVARRARKPWRRLRTSLLG